MPLKKPKKINKLVICLTGPAGAGKTTLANFLQKKGYRVIYVDELGHKALLIAKDDIKRIFGNDVVDEKGKVLHDRLRDKLKTKDDWAKLESITHPLIYKLLKKEIEESDSSLCFVDAAIPFTIGIDTLCSVIVKIDAPVNLLKDRLMKRGMDKQFIENILRKQASEFNREFSFTIENTGNVETFLDTAYRTIKKILDHYRTETS